MVNPKWRAERDWGVRLGLEECMSQLWGTVKRMFGGGSDRPPDLDATLTELRTKTPAPVFWLVGKTQSGKTSIIKFLTGAEDAAIGSGFRPTTQTTRRYRVPHPRRPAARRSSTPAGSMNRATTRPRTSRRSTRSRTSSS